MFIHKKAQEWRRVELTATDTTYVQNKIGTAKKEK
jgi:hypothetical protein